mmetsp:Transcript_110430/g.356449  ORF Transcript_110430/g.356449 Transcript_110430/m.356449 type:complete len:222 (+) Transcript_110430:2828-3493(+)
MQGLRVTPAKLVDVHLVVHQHLLELGERHGRIHTFLSSQRQVPHDHGIQASHELASFEIPVTPLMLQQVRLQDPRQRGLAPPRVVICHVVTRAAGADFRGLVQVVGVAEPGKDHLQPAESPHVVPDLFGEVYQVRPLCRVRQVPCHAAGFPRESGLSTARKVQGPQITTMHTHPEGEGALLQGGPPADELAYTDCHILPAHVYILNRLAEDKARGGSVLKC